MGWREFALALLAAIAFLDLSVGLFQLGIKTYRAVSLIGAAFAVDAPRGDF